MTPVQFRIESHLTLGRDMFYIVKDGFRIVTLAVEYDGKLYAFIPNFRSFVYNRPMSVDFQIDREMTYEPISKDAAEATIRDGALGELDESILNLFEHESQILTLDQVGIL